MSGTHRLLSSGVSCVSYDLAVTTKVAPKLLKVEWDVLILDESHYLGNRKAKRSRFVWHKLVPRARHVFCLSGTPAGNNIAEVWPMLNALGYYRDDYWSFVDEFCEGFDDGWQFRITGAKAKAMPKYKALLAQCMLRRRKSEVLAELPKITFSEISVEPGPVDEALHFPEWRNGIVTRGETLAQHVEKGLLTLQGALSLIQDMHAGSARAETTQEMLDGLEAPLSTMRRYVALQKVPGLCDMLEDELANGLDKVVIFAIHRVVMKELQLRLEKYKPLLYWGGLEPAKRQKNIDDFQNDPKRKIFIGQLQACGTAVTLHAACNIIILEPGWNPVANAQAIMRVHRFGQTRPVLARFVSLPDPVDQRVQDVLRKKTRALALADLNVE